MTPRALDPKLQPGVREAQDIMRVATAREFGAQGMRVQIDDQETDAGTSLDLRLRLPLEVAKRRIVELEAHLRQQNDELQMLRKACRTGSAADHVPARRAAEISAAEALSRLAHDLRTPLATVTAWLTVLKQSRLEPTRVREAVAAIARSTERQTELLDGLSGYPQPRRVTTQVAGVPASPQHAVDMSAAGARLDSISVLLVDDEADLRVSLAHTLRLAGATVFSAGDAMEALTLLRVERPDVLVCDIEMPQADGHELMHRIRRLPAAAGGQVKALALSAREGTQDVCAALDAGFEMHLSKAAHADVLVQAIGALAKVAEDA